MEYNALSTEFLSVSHVSEPIHQGIPINWLSCCANYSGKINHILLDQFVWIKFRSTFRHSSLFMFTPYIIFLRM